MTPDKRKAHEKEFYKFAREIERNRETEKPIREEFNEYLELLEAAGEPIPSTKKERKNMFLNFMFMARVFRNTQLANQTRLLAIYRAADEFDLDPSNEHDREYMLGVLAYTAFPFEIPKMDERGRPKGSIKWTEKKYRRYKRDVDAISPSNKSKDWSWIRRHLKNWSHKNGKPFSAATLEKYYRRASLLPKE